MYTISSLEWVTIFCALLMLGVVSCRAEMLGEDETRNIGSRLELFVDDWLIETMRGAELRLHHPVPREVVWEDTNQVSGKIWEHASTDGVSRNRFVSVFQDGDIYRMYYRDQAVVRNEIVIEGTFEHANHVACYAESRDGIHWERPDLNLFETDDLIHNNIIWAGTGDINFTPFKDMNPNSQPGARYKALGRIIYEEGRDPAPPQPDATGYNWPSRCGIVAFQSPDGIHWSLMQEERIIKKGEFDSQNVAFWDALRGRYVAFERVWQADGTRVRGIATLTSDDFLHWTDPPQWLEYGDAPVEHLYENVINIYPRSPHLFVAFPMRLVGGRTKIPDNPLSGEHAVDDTVFMTSRDGVHFHRWLEAFIRPGSQTGRWWNENNCPAWGIVTTRSHIEGTPDELSFYTNEYYGSADNNLRRYTLRMDGFVSVHAKYAGGEFTTKPLTFAGSELLMNYSTSAVGSVRVEIQDQEGTPIPGFTLADCPEIYGDAIEEVVKWKSGSDVSALTGQVVRLRFVMKDADLYAIRFRP